MLRYSHPSPGSGDLPSHRPLKFYVTNRPDFNAAFRLDVACGPSVTPPSVHRTFEAYPTMSSRAARRACIERLGKRARLEDGTDKPKRNAGTGRGVCGFAGRVVRETALRDPSVLLGHLKGTSI
jgi:hypothetical protein